MELILPKNSNQSRTNVKTNTLVVLGANGAGKSSFGRMLAKLNPEHAMSISAMRALFVEYDRDQDKSLIDPAQLKNQISKRMFSFNMSKYDELLLRLQEEEFEAAVIYKDKSKSDKELEPPVTKLDIVQSIWEKMFPYNQLVRKPGFFELKSSKRESPAYASERMSDGEKIVFYLIGSILCAKENALLIIDGPEILLHNSIKTVLWNEIEQLRPDCTFAYLTRDIDLAASRENSYMVWIRWYDADTETWSYERIVDSDNMPEELYLEILGSRKPVIFIEGDRANSIDHRLYSLIFRDYYIKPVGGCQSVIDTTRTLRQIKDFHFVESIGIVDRDRRSWKEMQHLRDQHIYVPDVAEVENLLMLEAVIKAVAVYLRKDETSVFNKIKKNIIQLFSDEVEAQLMMHVRHRIDRRLDNAVNRKFQSIGELDSYLAGIHDDLDAPALYNDLKKTFMQYIAEGDYHSILQVYNQKGMIAQSQLPKLLGLSNKDHYVNLILSILRKERKGADRIRKAIRKSLGMNSSEL